MSFRNVGISAYRDPSNPINLTQRQQDLGIRQARGQIELMHSSWIRDIKYNYITGVLYIKMNSTWYGPWNVEPKTFHKFIMGKAVPVTNDPDGRWSRNDSRSLGAAYHKYIKIGGGPSAIRRLGSRLTRFGQIIKERYEALRR